MHEMAIATGLLRQVLAAAEAHDVERVEEVHVTCGVLRLVVPEALRAAFEVLRLTSIICRDRQGASTG